MKNGIKGYIVKEYGAWSVLIAAYGTGLAVAGGWSWAAVPVFIALALLTNSKQSFMLWVRRSPGKGPLGIFLAQLFIAAVLLIALFGRDMQLLLPLLVIPAAYLVSNRVAGEHHLLTELLGFVLLSLAAVLAKFTIVKGVDVRLFVAVALYFTAGVFKVKVLLLGRTRDRVLAVLHAVLAVYAYSRFHIPLIILLPLIDNLAVAVLRYPVRLKTTGWIEVGKSLLFLLLMILYF